MNEVNKLLEMLTSKAFTKEMKEQILDIAITKAELRGVANGYERAIANFKNNEIVWEK